MLGVGWGPSMPGTHPTLPGLPTLCMTQSNSLSIQSSSNAPGTRLCAVRTLHWCAPGAARAGAGRRHAATPVPAGGCDAAAPVPGGKAARAAGGWGSALLCLQGTCISTRCAARHAPAAEASSTPGGFSSGPCPAPARPRMCPPPPPLPLPQASTERSQALYARHGFAHIADKPLGEAGEEGAPVLRVMVRPPSGPTLAAAADGAARA